MNENDLLSGTVAINQFRNAIYELIVSLKTEKKYSEEVITAILKQMGSNIASNYFKFWKPKSIDLEESLKEIYQFIFEKKVKVTVEPNEILVTQKNCPFCKYLREDAGLAGCNIILGVIENYFMEHDARKLKGSVISSKTLGDKNCIHKYEY